MVTLAGARRRLRGLVVAKARPYPWYPALYGSWWHRGMSGNLTSTEPNYLTGTPNPGAGIGHQLANWIAGYWFARRFGLRYAHSPFRDPAWEKILGFGAGEADVPHLVAQGYKRVRLPMFDEDSQAGIDLVSKIVRSHAGERVVFVLEQDQFFFDQGLLRDDLAAKYWASRTVPTAGEREVIKVAMHIRRGDIVGAQHNQFRLQSLDYFSNILDQLTAAAAGCTLSVSVFSQGRESDYASLTAAHPDIRFCLDWNEYATFEYLVAADVLVTSKSSFSYKAALLGRGLKICPEGFWHGYPKDQNWLVASADGAVDPGGLERFFRKMQARGMGESNG